MSLVSYLAKLDLLHTVLLYAIQAHGNNGVAFDRGSATAGITCSE